MAEADLTPEEQAILSAWIQPGWVPNYHYKKVAELRRDWPVLARAIEALATKAMR